MGALKSFYNYKWYYWVYYRLVWSQFVYTGPRKKNKLLNFQGLISRARLVYKHNPNYFRPKSDAYVSIQVMLIGLIFRIYQGRGQQISCL